MDDITRRAALGMTGRAVLGASAGGALLARPGQQATGPRLSRPRPARRAPDWAALARQLRGPLLRPGDRGYAGASLPYNKRYASIRPEGVALCADTADVQAALRWARRSGVPFAARSGGHSYGGYSTSHGLVISLARMNQVQVDTRSMIIRTGAGARNHDLYAALAGTSVAVPSGRCPTVAVSGLLLGGGFGFSSRHLGLTCDHLLHTEVVTASGEVLQVSAQSHPDLFWACRGGGGGNFGINTRYALRAEQVGSVSVYKLEWAWKDARAALSSMLGLMSQAPDTLSCRLGLDVRGGGRVTGGAPERGVSALGLYFGPGRELAGLLEPVLAAAWPARQQIEDRSYTRAQAFLAHSAPTGKFASKSRYLAQALPDAGLDTALGWIERWPGSANPGGGGLTMFAWGGAISRVGPAATAFVHRDAAFLTDQEFTWTARDDDRVVSAGLEWLAEGYHQLAPFGTRQAYQNFIDPSLPDWRTAYYGANLPRLTRVKHRYDPDDVFRFPQSVPEPPR
ncbi:MAG TPA: FAD-binding oxidoreductase [Streptosporangiaceae bacterium]|nr:FAD-binding oxidoreductase [Streptosporangiaceae bacterium]